MFLPYRSAKDASAHVPLFMQRASIMLRITSLQGSVSIPFLRQEAAVDQLSRCWAQVLLPGQKD